MKYRLEMFVIPVSDVDRAKAFYEQAGFVCDVDHQPGPEFRVVQFTPPGSGVRSASVWGCRSRRHPGITRAYILSSRTSRTRSPIFVSGASKWTGPFISGQPARPLVWPRSASTMPRSDRSAIPTATAGSSKKYRLDPNERSDRPRVPSTG